MSLRETFARRIRSLSYLKRCLSIVSYPMTPQGQKLATTPAWLDVIKLSKRDLEIIYETEKMKKRTNRNHILGCSIAPTLDYSSSAELARALLAIFNEVETMGEGGDKDKAKMVSQNQVKDQAHIPEDALTFVSAAKLFQRVCPRNEKGHDWLGLGWRNGPCWDSCSNGWSRLTGEPSGEFIMLTEEKMLPCFSSLSYLFSPSPSISSKQQSHYVTF